MSASSIETSKPAYEIYYGLTVVNPAMHCEITTPPLTWREWIHALAVETWWMFSQCFLLAASITAFRFAFS